MASHNTACGKMAKNQTNDGQIEWLLRSNHMTIRLQNDHMTARVFLILSVVSKVNATEWLVHGMTTLQASHTNVATIPPVIK